MWCLQAVAIHSLADIWIAPETFANANGIVAGLSQQMTRLGEYREVLFWLLLLGSWQFLASPGGKNAVVGAGGALIFLLFAFRNLGRLTRLGLGYASWRPTSRARWALGAASGLIAGIVIFGIGSASGKGMIMSSNWRLALLQVTLGPVLEEVVFRGYLFSLLTWALHRAASEAVLNWLVVGTGAVVFALVHLAQPGVSWLQLACITMTGSLYGWIRTLSASTAPAALAHAVYNLTLYGVASVLENARL
jgi:membrane protease YdiL (CAAX protease family)